MIRVAQAGIRGVPANFGGSETAVEEIGTRLAAEGVDVVVYCRRHKSPTDAVEYRGMRRVVLPSIPSFHLDTISHSVIATLHLRFRNTADVVHYHGMGNALCLPLLAGSRKKAVITIDGPDWERPKWGPLARRVLRLSARLAVRQADYLVIDNHPSIEYFRREFGVPESKFTYIAYGADTDPPSATDALTELELAPRGYILFVGALVPDKGPDILIDAYRNVGGEMPVVVVGDSPFAPEFRRRLHEAASADPRVRMLGYVYGEAYRQLVANAYVYVHPLRSDGTSPALLQAMGYGNCVVSSDLPEVIAATGNATITFASGDASALTQQLGRVLVDPELVERHRALALARVRAEYSWDDVAARHRVVYENLLGEG
ncbi:MAG TPA: glycosyltransferase family 4 protein [Gaiellaceae bacterium]|nr:glycosyltransferase family 4 protein [Gaiellaceae bacterium]